MRNNFTEVPRNPKMPARRARFLFRERNEKANSGDIQLAATQGYGVISQKRYQELSGNRVTAALAGTDNFQKVYVGDFVISLRTFEGGIEYAFESGCISPAYTILVPLKEVEASFFRYALKSSAFLSALQTTVTGIREGKSVKYKDFADLILPLPDLPPQKAIADFLDRETARIDQLIEKKQRLVELLLETNRSKLDRLTFQAREKGSWKVVPFKWICRIPSGQVDPQVTPWNELPLIAPNHIESGTGRILSLESAQEQGAESGKYYFPAGTVIYSKIRPALMKACISPVKGLCSADMYPIVPSKGLLPQFLLMQLLSQTFTDWAVLESMRVAMPKINRETLGSFRLLVPPIGHQEEIIKRWNVEDAKTQSIVGKVIFSINRLRELRSALITAAVTGQIDVATFDRKGTLQTQLDTLEQEVLA